MNHKRIRLMAVIMIIAMLFTGCSDISFEEMMEQLYSAVLLGASTSFEDMEYSRPDLAAFDAQLEETLSQAQTQEDADDLMAQVYLFYEYYYDFYTNYSLANIRYCQNMTDIYWDTEYSWCLENAAQVDAGLDSLLYALADSPLKEDLETEEYFGEDFFDAYQGDSLWDETFTELMTREAKLLDEYYALEASLADGDHQALEENFVQLVQVRQEIARYAGYDNYADFAYAFYYYRDYTATQTETYLQQIAQELAPMYQSLDVSIWDEMYTQCSTEEVYAYLTECVNRIGGIAEGALALMEGANLYDISYGEHKYDASFETFLYSYYEPFVFMNPTGYTLDKLTLVHEFGHFCNDYAVGGTVVGVDVAEVFSQGLEYLSLTYCQEGQKLTKGKMGDSLCVFVEQAAYALFEQQVYQLEEVTVETIRDTFDQAMSTFGLDVYRLEGWDYITIPHVYIAPMYVISYVVSNDVAMQIYQAELENAGSGVTLWEDGLYSTQIGIVAFTEEMDLTSPFAEGRVQQIRQTLEQALG